MKKDIAIFITNIVAILCAVVLIINVAPNIAAEIGVFNQGVIKVFFRKKFLRI